MNFYFYSSVKFVHVLFASVWFGASILSSRDVRQTIEAGRPHLDLLVRRITATERVGISSGVATLLSGLGLVFLAGGFEFVSSGVSIGLAITIVTFIVGALLASPTWRRILKIIKLNGDLGQAKMLASRFAIYMYIEHFFRTVTLALMVIKF